jgi:hypothetical protein
MTVHIDGANPPVFIPRSNELVVLEIEAGGSNGLNATPIISYGSNMVVYVATDDADKGVRLPEGEIGDSIVILGYPASIGFHLYRPDSSDVGGHQPTYRRAPYGWTDHT